MTRSAAEVRYVTEAAQAWQVFERDTPVLTCTYSFGSGIANALAVGGEGGLIVVSPPWRSAEQTFEQLREYGGVRALVAPNAFHYMGSPEWKRRFPEAVVFAPARSLPRIRRKTRLRDVRPLSEAGALIGSRVELIDMPYYRTGEVLVRIRSSRGTAWYITDVILNLREPPNHPVIRFLLKVTGSVPGLSFNHVAATFMVKNRSALKQWLAEEYERAPPRWLIPAHGEIVDVERERVAVQRLFASAAPPHFQGRPSALRP